MISHTAVGIRILEFIVSCNDLRREQKVVLALSHSGNLKLPNPYEEACFRIIMIITLITAHT